jgi:hypothetical protein
MHEPQEKTNHFVNCVGDVMVDMFVLSAGFHDFEPRLCQTKDYEIGICYFSTNHITLRSKSKDCQEKTNEYKLTISHTELDKNL